MNRVGDAADAPPFPDAAKLALADPQLRRNVRHATDVIRNKRSTVVEEMTDWQALREAGHQIKAHTLRYLDTYLELFEGNCVRAGGEVHWARDADDANRTIIEIIQAHRETEVIKVKTMTSDETRLNVALADAGITPYETDLADLIIQLGDDTPSHIVVPALHRNRTEIRQLFKDKMRLTELGDQAEDLTNAARLFLREKFFSGQDRLEQGELRDRGDRVGVCCRIRRQRTYVPDAPERLDHAGRDREGHPDFCRSRSVSPVAATVRDGGADEPVQLDLDRDDRR